MWKAQLLYLQRFLELYRSPNRQYSKMYNVVILLCNHVIRRLSPNQVVHNLDQHHYFSFLTFVHQQFWFQLLSYRHVGLCRSFGKVWHEPHRCFIMINVIFLSHINANQKPMTDTGFTKQSQTAVSSSVISVRSHISKHFSPFVHYKLATCQAKGK